MTAHRLVDLGDGEAVQRDDLGLSAEGRRAVSLLIEPVT